MNALSIGLDLNRVLKDLFAGRVYPQFAGLDTPAPFAVYNRDTITRNYDGDGYDESVQVGLSIVSNSYAEAIELAEKVDDLMHRRLRARMVSAGEAYAIDDKIYIQELNYSIDTCI